MSKLANKKIVLSEQQLIQQFILTNQDSVPVDIDNIQHICKRIAQNLNTEHPF